MNDSKNHSGLRGVDCGVQSCKYQDPSGKCCTADHICVESKSKTNKEDACCGTFCPRSGC